MNFFFKKKYKIEKKSNIADFTQSFLYFLNKHNKINNSIFGKINKCYSINEINDILITMIIGSGLFCFISRPFLIILFPAIFFFITFKVAYYVSNYRIKNNDEQFMLKLNELFSREENQFKFLHELSEYKKLMSEKQYQTIIDNMTNYFLNPENKNPLYFSEVFTILKSLENKIFLNDKKQQFNDCYQEFITNNPIHEKEEINIKVTQEEEKEQEIHYTVFKPTLDIKDML